MAPSRAFGPSAVPEESCRNWHPSLIIACEAKETMIEIQCKRPGDADFITIGFDSSEPYLDSRAPVVAGQPEVRQYRARYHDGTGPIGIWSDIVSATAQP